MDCEDVRAAYAESLVAGQSMADAAAHHLLACSGCREEAERLTATWTALGSLPLAEPSPRVGRILRRRVRWEAAREALRSLERWQEAALAGVVGFVLSVLLGLALPYEVMIAACQAVVPAVPGALAYLMSGLVYGLIPMALSVAGDAWRRAVPGIVGAVEAPVVFLVALVPYVVLRCGEFPLALLTGFIAGIATGAVLGGGAGAWLGRRHAWA